MQSSKIHEIALAMIPGIGGTLSKTLVSYCGSAEKIFSMPKGKLKKIPGIGEHLANTIISNRQLIPLAEQQVKKAENENVKILFYTDPDYPERLRQIYDAPPLLFYKGSTSLNPPKTVGIVGTRQATDYGRQITEKIVEALVPYAPVVISGLAYGIDITAHKAAMQYGLETIGAMATGIDSVYPAAHRETAKKMICNGGLITEYHFESRLDPSKFPARNRIIAGLSDLVIVVEAAAKGGALITAEMANEYNREVFAIPGNVGNKYSEGCNKLIQKHKAHIYTDISSIEFVMNWELNKKNPINTKSRKKPDMSDLQEEEKAVVEIILSTEEILLDDLSWKSNIPLSKLASILLNLEFKGLVKGLPGKKFKIA